MSKTLQDKIENFKQAALEMNKVLKSIENDRKDLLQKELNGEVFQASIYAINLDTQLDHRLEAIENGYTSGYSSKEDYTNQKKSNNPIETQSCEGWLSLVKRCMNF